MRASLAAVLVAAALASASHAQDETDVRVTKWLVLAPVDPTPRRTLRPDAVFAKHLLDRTSAPPKEGDELTGTLGKPAKWATKAADADGDVELGNGGWAYASVESATDRVVLAKLEGAGVMYVNGAGFPGDVYRLGDVGVPVALRKGANDVYVAGARGTLRLTLVEPKRGSYRQQDGTRRPAPDIDDDARQVIPDQVEGLPFESRRSRRFWNASTGPMPYGEGRTIVSLGVCSSMSVGVMGWGGGPDRVLGPHEPRRRVFESEIDGTLQSYALVPPSPSDIDKSKIGLVLSLHGAGVECMDHAKAYAPKPDFWIVCPTNRGRFGFDWQDWGRLDAYEVLEDALKVTGVDPRRVYLTGHSMGGHGTWHLAANDPGRFLAIAPSAGWCSFETYQPASQITSPLAWMWRAADGASRTFDLVDNLAQVPTYVLHGGKDDNVPLSEAQLMVDAITRAGGKPEFHVEPGMGHWWDKDEKTPGGDCVDWPGIWELFRRTPDGRGKLGDLDAVTSRPIEVGWVRVDQPIEYGRLARISARWVDETKRWTLTTENVRRLALNPPRDQPQAPHHPIPYVHCLIDGQSVAGDTWDFVRLDGRWRPERLEAMSPAPWRSSEKCLQRSDPFKSAFTNRFVLVYGTAGTDAEDAELLEKARYDSEVWAYRANGDANLMSDAQFLAGDFKDRNVIVYGNADTNSAWTAVFDDDCPIQAKRGTMTVNGTKHEGVVAAAFVRPRKGSHVALAAAFADTGAAATRLFYAFPVFSSGIGIPDYVVFGPGFLKEWDGDVRAAGWFDWAWRMR